jgi:23S rRNA U2552 (ribose-2'-O)-methylase RlmE/FtsJ
VTWTEAQQRIHADAWEAARAATTEHHASQRFDELTGALGTVANWLEGDPSVIVEIGCDAGGTLYAWQAMFRHARVYGITLDDNGPHTGGQGYPLATHGATVIRGDSHDPSTRQRLKDQLGGRPVDVLFIDGDHSWGGIDLDWRMYAPLVRDRGLVVFHDVANTSTPEAVAHWEQMKSVATECGEPYAEIVSKQHRPVGFGIVRHGWERS